MDEIESQIAKIALGNNKSSSTYVFASAEKAPVGNSELYVVAELPLFNPAALQSCEDICLAIASALKRAYKRPSDENTFENALENINEELGKLAGMGQTQWINKLNCILAVKDGFNLNIATCGRVSAFMLRNSEYTDISCSPAQSHPLKTFENYAGGKTRLGDLIILSTTQLFNFLSMDRLLHIMSEQNFLTGTRTVIELLKQVSDPQISFGTLFNLQVRAGQVAEQEVDLENYIVETPGRPKNILVSVFNYFKTVFALNSNNRRSAKTDLPRPLENSANQTPKNPNQTIPILAQGLSFTDKMKKMSLRAKNLAEKSKDWITVAKASAQSAGRTVNPQKFKTFSSAKKFLLISAIILFFAVITNIVVAIRIKNTGQENAQVSGQLKEVQSLLLNAQSASLYKDSSGASDYLVQAKNKLPKESEVGAANKDLYNKLLADIKNAEGQIERNTETKVVSLGNLGVAENLIKLPAFLAVSVNKTLISYGKNQGIIQDGALVSPVNITESVYTTGNLAAVYDNGNLYVWDFSSGKDSVGFSQSVPQKTDFAGMAYYPTGQRVYAVDKKAGTITSFIAGNSGFSKPVISVRDTSILETRDIAIDGAIYILTNTTVLKFQNGKPATFDFPKLPTPLSGSGKIYTQKEFKFIYILDSGNNRVLILDKKGSLTATLKSSQFTKLKDFEVDEKGKIIYLLNDGSLLKVSLP